MIHWYRFKNFYSYCDDTLVDMSLKKNSSETNYDFYCHGKRYSKVLAVMGPNGSGKSNLLRPLAFLSWFCSNSFKEQEQDDLLPFYPYKLNENEDTEIEVCFSLPYGMEKESIFKYSITLNKSVVVKEELRIKREKPQYIKIFGRKINKSNKYKIDVRDSYNFDDAFSLDEIKLVPNNISVISYLSRKEAIFPRAINTMFSSIYSNLNLHGKNNLNYRKVLQTARKYYENKEIFNDALKLIKEMDFGIHDIHLKEDDLIESDTGKTSKQIIPYGIHKCGDKEFDIPFLSESSGTQALFSFALPLISALRVGGVAVMDEIDSDLHPLMVLSILSLFENEETNKFNAQLIFSCHTPEILRRLKKHHVYLVEKVNSMSESWRLDDIIGLRSQDNLYAKYMTGALGGVPDISL
ncbi:ATP-binding protein [Morganella morganii]|nr:ATP-binding protein [Morganella morganii]HCR4019790.1 ATP-binding protein [Morganella morganii]